MTFFQSKQNKKHSHTFVVDADTRELVCLECGATPGEKKSENKFRAKKSNYQGYVYHSQKEANYAAELDLLLKAGEIKSWERQVPLEVYAEGKHIFTTKVDFRVITKTDGIEWHEVKGYITARQPDYRLKRKLIELFYLPKHPNEEYKEIQ